ncbi:TetR/AcrR family transcriptional regulator [Catenulispora subtropica]|uniref:HTH tetR-type domain-containing protein n=1 Tax=Catenulispora subtropica TaxID=450798 RepID=A0ABP5E8S2_9ACTN
MSVTPTRLPPPIVEAPHVTVSSAALAPLPGARDARDPQRAIKRGPSRVPREQVAAAQRDRLYDGLVRTVAEQGYANASVSDICRASGVTRPAFYEHFESKQGAFLAAYRHGTDVLFAMLRDAYAGAVGQDAATGAPARPDCLESWTRATRAVLGVLLDVLSSVPAFAAAAIVEIDAVGPEGRRARAGRLRDFEAFFAPAPATPPEVDRDELVRGVVSGAYGTLYRYIAEGRGAELPGLLPDLVYFVVAPFAGPEPAARAAAEARGAHQRSVAPCVPALAGAGVTGASSG